MQDALNDLKNRVCSFVKPHPLSGKVLDKIKKNTVVVLMVGGESSRFKEVSGLNTEINKNVFKLPNDDTMIEMAIRMYRDVGIKEFVALVYHHAGSIENLLGDGHALGVKIRYCADPGKPVGKGGAVKNALEKGFIPKLKYFIVHNPDDTILDYPGSFVEDILTGHFNGEEKGALVTVITVEGTTYTYTGMQVLNSFVNKIEMYPVIPIPTHIGVTVFSPGIYKYFMKNFSYEKKSDFEKVLFPILSSKKKLYSISIPNSTWLAVNNPKTYNELLVRLGLK